jgi:hypothetical protein
VPVSAEMTCAAIMEGKAATNTTANSAEAGSAHSAGMDSAQSTGAA